MLCLVLFESQVRMRSPPTPTLTLHLALSLSSRSHDRKRKGKMFRDGTQFGLPPRNPRPLSLAAAPLSPAAGQHKKALRVQDPSRQFSG
jgi:hypothetical protein